MKSLSTLFLVASISGCSAAGAPDGSVGDDATRDTTVAMDAPTTDDVVAMDAPTTDDAMDASLDAAMDAERADEGADARDARGRDARTDAGAMFGGFTCSGAMPAFQHSVVPILTTHCSGSEICHFGFGGSSGAYAALVNVRATRDSCDAGVLVLPGDPSRSYVVHKITDTAICSGSSPMPIGTALSHTDIQTIYDWICSGAPNN